MQQQNIIHGNQASQQQTKFVENDAIDIGDQDDQFYSMVSDQELILNEQEL